MNGTDKAVIVRLAKIVLKLLESHHNITNEIIEVCHEINWILNHRYQEKDYTSESEVKWLKQIDERLIALNHAPAFEDYHDDNYN
jgi:hypothetical protein